MALCSKASFCKSTTNHTPSLTQGNSLRKDSRSIRLPLVLPAAGAIFLPTATPTFVAEFLYKKRIRTNSPFDWRPVRKTVSNSHDFFRRIDETNENKTALLAIIRFTKRNYTARRRLPLRLRLRRMRRPLGDDERTKKPMRRFLRVLCGWNVLFIPRHLLKPNSSQNNQGTISQKNEANNLACYFCCSSEIMSAHNASAKMTS